MHGKPRRSHSSRPQVRKGSFTVDDDIAERLRSGHPWLYRREMGTRAIDRYHGKLVQLTDRNRKHIAYAVADQDGNVCARLVDWSSKTAPDLQGLLKKKTIAAWRRRKSLLPPEYEALAFRVLNGDNEGAPGITVDYYGGFAVVHVFAESMESYVDGIFDGLVESMAPIGVYVQNRFRSVGGKKPEQTGAKLVRGQAAPIELEVEENGLKFSVDVTSPLSTGLFCDLRLGREKMLKHCAGADVLNLFSYTGAFSVYARHGGAKSVTAVDTAPKAHARSRKNLRLNELDEETVEHITGDARAVLAKFADRSRHFDLTIVDPPSFGSPASRGAKPWVAKNDYAELLTGVAKVTSPGGMIIAVSSMHNLRPSEFDAALAFASMKSRRSFSVLERISLPWDFPTKPGFHEGEYLKAALLLLD